MTQDSTTLARRYLDMWNRADPSVVDEILAADVSGHVNGATLHGREVFKSRVGALHRAYADVRFTVEDAFAAGDRAVVRWRFQATNAGSMYGRPATGRAVDVTGMNIFRVEHGRIREIWVNADDLGELAQLGLVDVPRGAGE